MAFFNINCFESVRTFQSLLLCNNSVTNNLFGTGILLMVFFISFISMLGFGQKNSLAASLWLTTVVSVYLWIQQLFNPDYMVLLTVITAMVTIFMFRTKEN
jgi:hypothetical protein